MCMKNATLNRDFLLGGRAGFVVKNPAGEKYEYRVRLSKPKPNSKYGPTYFVSLVDAKHPRSKYGAVYMGILNKDTLKVKKTYASAFDESTREWKVVEWAIALMEANIAPPDGYTLTHVGKCGRCGRKLTDEVSKARGIGPECMRQITMKTGGAVGTPHEKTVVVNDQFDEADVNGNDAVVPPAKEYEKYDASTLTDPYNRLGLTEDNYDEYLAYTR
jgi:hypothetical protein